MAGPDTGPRIRRRFADLPFGQIHYREAGDAGDVPLLLLHGSPGSSAQLVALIAALAPHRRVIAPDTAGYGDSTPLPLAEPSIIDFAAIIPTFLDAIGVDRVAIYGFHTGACIAAETAIACPNRVDRVILDGVGLYGDGLREKLLAHYAHPFTPDQDGAYLIRAFQFLRDQSIFWPWFDRSRAARRDGGLMPADRLHAWIVELLKAAETYHLGYRAAFRWDALQRLSLLSCPVLIAAAADDPLARDSADVARRVATAEWIELPRFDDDRFNKSREETIFHFFDRSNFTQVP